MSLEVKICGLCRPEDARRASDAGADYLGVVLTTGPRRRTPDQARRIWDALPVRRVGVFVDTTEDGVVALARSLELGVVQLHGAEPPEFCRRIASAGDWSVWKAIRVQDPARLLDRVAPYAPVADGVLLDGFSRRGRGGVGASFDWAAAARTRDRWPAGLRLILAGGLRSDNLEQAIGALRPDVVDVSSGVEARVGVKDADAVQAFVDTAKGASR